MIAFGVSVCCVKKVSRFAIVRSPSCVLVNGAGAWGRVFLEGEDDNNGKKAMCSTRLPVRVAYCWFLFCCGGNLRLKTCRALAHLHARRILHRDLKAENVLFNRRRNAFLLADFGHAFQCKDKTICTDRSGTPGMSPPEVALVRNPNPASPPYQP